MLTTTTLARARLEVPSLTPGATFGVVSFLFVADLLEPGAGPANSERTAELATDPPDPLRVPCGGHDARSMRPKTETMRTMPLATGDCPTTWYKLSNKRHCTPERTACVPGALLQIWHPAELNPGSSKTANVHKVMSCQPTTRTPSVNGTKVTRGRPPDSFATDRTSLRPRKPPPRRTSTTRPRPCPGLLLDMKRSRPLLGTSPYFET